MTYKLGSVERSYQLARGGKKIAEIKQALRAEGHDPRIEIHGKQLVGDLKRLAKAAG